MIFLEWLTALKKKCTLVWRNPFTTAEGCQDKTAFFWVYFMKNISSMSYDLQFCICCEYVHYSCTEFAKSFFSKKFNNTFLKSFYEKYHLNFFAVNDNVLTNLF